MRMIFDHSHLRSEFDWLAQDSAQFLGYFATAGQGPIPRAVEESASRFDSLQDDVLRLPLRGEAVLIASVEWDVSEWLDVARRGLFAFDWRSGTQRYELIARPSSPIQLAELRTHGFGGIAGMIVLEGRFADVSAFTVLADRLTPTFSAQDT